MIKRFILLSVLSLFFTKAIAAEYQVKVSLDNQTVSIYEDEKLIKSMLCSTAKAPNVTPTGQFQITGKKDISTLVEEKINYYHLSFFNGKIAFHSTLYDFNDNLITPNEDILGTPNSGGCVRLALENAKWIYENLPVGTTVNIE